MNRRLTLLPILAVYLMCASLQAQSQPGNSTASQQPVAPLTLPQVIEAMVSYPPQIVEARVRERGVAFYATPDVLAILREFGATTGFIDLIPQPPPASGPDRAGALTVICEPADCSFIVNEKYYGLTEQGKRVVDDLSPGDAQLIVFSAGYQRETRVLELRKDQAHEERFSLRRDSGNPEQTGKSSILDMIQAGGGIDAVASLRDIVGDGRLQWIDSNGQSQRWTMTFREVFGRQFGFVFKGDGGECSVTVPAGDPPKSTCKGKFKDTFEKNSDMAAYLFLNYQMQNVIRTVLRGKVQSAEDEGKRLEISTDGNSYQLTLDDARLPSELVHRPSGGSPLKIQYSNYQTIGSARYPMEMGMGLVDGTPIWVFSVQAIRPGAGR